MNKPVMGPLLTPNHLLGELRRRLSVFFARMSAKCLSSLESSFTVPTFQPFFRCFDGEIWPSRDLVPDLKLESEIFEVTYISSRWQESLCYTKVGLGSYCNHNLTIDFNFKLILYSLHCLFIYQT